MGILDRLRSGLGVQRPIEREASSTDDQAIARYRYMLRTAPPETIEQAHAEAFAQLTPEQRRRVLAELASDMSAGERMAAARAGDDPRLLAQLATRAEIRNPGVLERAFGGVGGFGAGNFGQPGVGGLFAGSFLSSMAGTVLGSMIAQQFFSAHAGGNHLFGNDALADAGTHGAGVQPDASTAGLVHDPFADAAGTHAGSDAADSGNGGSDPDSSPFDSGGGDFDGGGGFDGGGDSFDV
jgi:hypothetical protein